MIKSVLYPLRNYLRYPLICFWLQVVAAVLALPVAVWVKSDGDFEIFLLWPQVLGFALIAAGVFSWVRSYCLRSARLNLEDVLQSLKSVGMTIVLFIPFILLTDALGYFSLLTLLIVGLTFSALLIAAQCTASALTGYTLILKSHYPKRACTLLVGIGAHTEAFLRDIVTTKQGPFFWDVLGIIGHRTIDTEIPSVCGVPVLGTLSQLDPIVRDLGAKGSKPECLILTDTTLKGQRLRDFLVQAAAMKLKVAQLPAAVGPIFLADTLVPERIGIEHLLEPYSDGLEAPKVLSLLRGKRVLITGAGGAISKTLLDQVLAYSPGHVTLIDHHEPSLQNVVQGISEDFPNLSYNALIADVRNKDKIFSILKAYKPHIVFHGATLKNSRILEPELLESVETNVLGTAHVADACVEHKVEHMFLLSDHQAVHTRNSMAVTKRVAEIYCQSLDVRGAEGEHATRLTPIRFGRVISTPDSVTHLFQKQIERCGPVTVAHPEAVGRFVSIHQAVMQILQACVLAKKALSQSKRGTIYVTSPGASVSILELAESMIRLNGLQPYRDIPIAFTGQDHQWDTLQAQYYDEGKETEVWMETTAPFESYATLVPTISQLREAVRQQKQEPCMSLLKTILKGPPPKQ